MKETFYKEHVANRETEYLLKLLQTYSDIFHLDLCVDKSLLTQMPAVAIQNIERKILVAKAINFQ